MNIFKKSWEIDPARGFWKRKADKYKNMASDAKSSAKSGGKRITGTFTEVFKEPYENVNKEREAIVEKVIEIVHTVFIVLAIAGIVLSFIRIVNVSGDSMLNTYQNGQKLICKVTKNVEKGDVIVFEATEETYGNSDNLIIKRVIATEGDIVECDKGVVYVNDIAIDDSYAKGKTNDFNKQEVDEGCVFVLGDNRENSVDSRDVGDISLKDVIGKVN